MKDSQWFSDCVFYDAELRSLRRHFYEIYKEFKDIEKRAARRQTVQISKSFFDYYDRKKDLKVCPQKYYDFRMDCYRICIFLFHSKYSVLCVGFDYDNRIHRFGEFDGAGKLYGCFNTWEEAIPLFREIVQSFVFRYIVKHDSQEEIPF